MALTLIVRLGKDLSHRLTFDAETIVIGRADDVDVRLPDPSVSQRHATIRSKGSDYTLTDEGSRNGSFIGGVQLSPNSPRMLKSGDLVRVGRVWLEVKIASELDERPNAAMATRELALALVSQVMKEDPTPKVRVVEGVDLGVELRLADVGRTYSVGRGDKCDLLLSDVDASREHVHIRRDGATVKIRNLGARNGVLLGKSELAPGTDAVWRGAVVVRVGSTVLALDEPMVRALEQLSTAADEAMSPEKADVPPEPAPPDEGDSRDAGTSHGETRPDAPSPAGAAAPIADVALPETPTLSKPTASRRSTRSMTGALVIGGAILVIVLSAVALLWLLRASG